jgi:rhodanese-related sulfurtransferase
MDEFLTVMSGYAVDVRDPADYGAGRIPGAVNIPLPDLASIADLLAARAALPQATLFILYGQNRPDLVAVNGALDLEDAGYRGVVLYTGGFDDWVAAGKPTEP